MKRVCISSEGCTRPAMKETLLCAEHVLAAAAPPGRARKPKTQLCRICRYSRVPVGTHACEVCE